MSGPVFFVCGAALIGLALALSKWSPAYVEAFSVDSEADNQMASRLAAAVAAYRRVFWNGPPPPSTGDFVFAAIGAAVVATVWFVSGPTISGLYALAFLLIQLALAAVCLEHDLLPDILTIPLAAIGLALGAQGMFATPSASIWGLLAGAALPLVAATFFSVFTGRDSLGEGVVKHAAATGAWLGPAAGLAVLFGSSLFGGFVLPAIRRLRSEDPAKTVSFGPIYAAAAAGVFVYVIATAG